MNSVMETMKAVTFPNITFISRCAHQLNTHRVDSFSSWHHRKFHVDIFARWNRLQPYKHVAYYGTSTDRSVPVHRERISLLPISHSQFLASHSPLNNFSLMALRNTPSLQHRCMQYQIRSLSTTVKSKLDFSAIGAIPSSSHSTSASEKSTDADRDDAVIKPEMSTKEKVQRLFKKYGVVFVGTYIGIYFTTLFSLFGLLECGLLDPELISQVFKVSKDLVCETADVIGPTGSGASMDEAATAYAQEMATEITKEKRGLVKIVTEYLQKYEWSTKYAEKLEQNPHLANLAVAWFMVKFTEPFRLAAAVAVVPKVAKMVGRKVPKEDAEAKV